MGHQITAGIMTWYPTQLHYPDPVLSSSFRCLVIPSTRLSSDKYQFDKSLVWLSQDSHHPPSARAVLPVVELNHTNNVRSDVEEKPHQCTVSSLRSSTSEQSSLFWYFVCVCLDVIIYCASINSIFISSNHSNWPDGMTDWIERLSPVLRNWAIRTTWVRTLVESNNGRRTLYSFGHPVWSLHRKKRKVCFI